MSDLGGAILGIIEDMEVVAVLDDVDDVLTVVSIIGCVSFILCVDKLLGSQTFMVVFISNGRAGFTYLFELSTGLPGVRPRAIIGRIADCVVSNRGRCTNWRERESRRWGAAGKDSLCQMICLIQPHDTFFIFRTKCNF